MTTETKDLPPVPEKSYLGDDVSYGYEAWDMHAYALEAIRASATSARELTPISDDELDLMCEKALFCRISKQQFARSIEAAHGIGIQPEQPQQPQLAGDK